MFGLFADNFVCNPSSSSSCNTTMSKDKHPGVARRKYALANIGHVKDEGSSKEKIVYDSPDHSVKNRRDYPEQRMHIRVNVSRAVDELERRGKIKRYRGRGLLPTRTHFKDMATVIRGATPRTHFKDKT
jgi:hypothetical protein